jgi:GNAT superfamily N-acetyltransferase
MPFPAVRRVITAGLSQYNREMAGYCDAKNLSVLVMDSQSKKVVGGLLGRTSLGLFFIDLLFLPTPLRGNGIGAQVIEYAEAEAKECGCSTAVLYTITFQAPGFMSGEVIGCLAGSSVLRPAIPGSA